MIYSTDRSKAGGPGDPGVSLTLCCFVIYSMRRFVLCLTLCYFVRVFFSPFSIAITSLGEERANLGAFRAFVRFVLVWLCRFSLPLGVWEGLRFVIVVPVLFSYFFRTSSMQNVLQEVIIIASQMFSYLIHYLVEKRRL